MAWWMFQNVVITAGLAAVVLGASRMSRLGPVARHWLWVLVLVKFVTPPIVAWPWPVPDPLGLATVEIASDNAWATTPANVRLDPARSPEGDVIAKESLQWRESVLERAAIIPDAAVKDRADFRAAAWWWLLAIWAAGSLCLLGVESIRALRLRQIIAHAEPGDPAIVARATTLAARMGLGSVRVLTLPGGGSPFICGWGRPLLVWPAELARSSTSWTDCCLDGLLVHELAHIKRRDHLLGWIELAASVVWWWNPLFWFVRAARREQAELACDAWVIAALPHGRRAYAESLLALSTLAQRSTPALAVGIRAHSRRILERRLVMIMKGRAPLRLPASGLLSLALLSAAILPTWAAGAQMPSPPPPAIVATTATPSSSIAQPTAERRAVVRETTRGTFDVAVSLDQSQPTPPPPPPPPPAQIVRSPGKSDVRVVTRKGPVKVMGPLPTEVAPLVDAFERDVDAMQSELERKTEARYDALVKDLQALQDKYTKAGQLDEAIAVRDYLRSGKAGRVFLKAQPLKRR